MVWRVGGREEILWLFGGRTGYVGLGKEPDRDGLCVCGGGTISDYAHADKIV